MNDEDDCAGVVLKDGRYVLAFWIFTGTSSGVSFDWLGTVYRDGVEQPWFLVSRFRFHRDEKTWPWESEDEKCWARVSFSGTEGEAEMEFDRVIQGIAALHRGSSPEKNLCRSANGQDVFELLAVHPMMTGGCPPGTPEA